MLEWRRRRTGFASADIILSESIATMHQAQAVASIRDRSARTSA
jgi:hypothetical protein